MSAIAIDLAAERQRRDRQYSIKLARELEFLSARRGDYAVAEAARDLRMKLERGEA